MRLPGTLVAGAAFIVVQFGANAAEPRSWFDSVAVVEVKGGVQIHDVARDHNESNTVDLTAEIVFGADEMFDFGDDTLNFVFNPRIILGGSVNTVGETHQAYAGFGWQYLFASGIFVGGSLSAMGHTGNLHQKTRACAPAEGCGLPGNRAFVDTGDPSLGSSILIREAAELGYRFEGGVSVSVFAAHMSNGGLASDNDGMDFVGVRFGYALEPRRR